MSHPFRQHGEPERLLRERKLDTALGELMALESWRGRQETRNGKPWPFDDDTITVHQRQVAAVWEAAEGKPFITELRKRFASSRGGNAVGRARGPTSPLTGAASPAPPYNRPPHGQPAMGGQE